jgi:hypothetical protein
MSEIKIAPLNSPPQTRGALSEILVEAVANVGSGSFMHPLAFWAVSSEKPLRFDSLHFA